MSKQIIKTIYSNFNPPFYVKSISNPDGNRNSLSIPSNKLESDHFFRSLRAYLILGKVIGLLPFSGVFHKHSSNELCFRRKSLTSIITHLIFISLILNMVLSIMASIRMSKRNALEIAESVRLTLYFVWGTYIFLSFLWRGNRFLEIFKSWNNTNIAYSTLDKTLRRDVLIITGVVFSSAILENLVLHLEYINSLDSISGNKHGDHTDNMTVLEAYYHRANPHWANVLSYNWFFAFVSFIVHKWILYAWNYIDVSIAIFARAMYFRFKSICEIVEEKLLGPQALRLDNDTSRVCQDQQAWLQIVYDHENLCRLLDVVETFFSPLIFVSYAVNMFYICLQLLDGLTAELSQHSVVHSIYAPWSFIHLIMRTFIVSICCARINVYAHKIRSAFQDCPVHNYSTEIARMDKRVTSGPDIGLTGLGCFVVTKPFILSILSVVFTLEIVLLQCVPNGMTSTTPVSGDCKT